MIGQPPPRRREQRLEHGTQGEDRRPESTGPAEVSTVRSLPPGPSRASTTVTAQPAAASSIAAASPPMPLPMTTARVIAPPRLLTGPPHRVSYQIDIRIVSRNRQEPPMDAVARIDRALEAALAAASAGCPPTLAAALRAAVMPGGARVRPGSPSRSPSPSPAATAIRGARRAAAAIELLHCASLVHDDMPCFDDAAVRRGRPPSTPPTARTSRC